MSPTLHSGTMGQLQRGQTTGLVSKRRGAKSERLKITIAATNMRSRALLNDSVSFVLKKQSKHSFDVSSIYDGRHKLIRTMTSVST